MPLVIIVNKKASQLVRKAYEDVDYTVVIAVVHLHKRIIIIVQKLGHMMWPNSVPRAWPKPFSV